MKKLSQILDQESNAFNRDDLKRFKNQRVKNESQEVFDFLQLIQKWSTIVGENLAKHTLPLNIRYKTLTILTRHSVYAQSLRLLQSQIQEKILKNFPSLIGKFQGLKFQANENLFKQKIDWFQKREGLTNIKKIKRTFHPHSPQYRTLKMKAEELFKDMEPEIREKLISMYIQSYSDSF